MNAIKCFLLGSGSHAAAPQVESTGQQQAGGNAAPASNQEVVVMGIKPSPSQHAALSLTHLRKLFSDFTLAAAGLTEPEKESRIYIMLPLFCRVFSHCPAAEMLEKFPEVGGFCQQVSRLAVSEIRRRASNQSTVAASQAIATFLEMDESGGQDSPNGWMLLTCLNLLSLGGPGLIEIMTAASVPSTLVKCLYLFFDLPDLGEDADVPGGEFTPRERRHLLQKSFGQVLLFLNICIGICNNLFCFPLDAGQIVQRSGGQ